METALSSPQQQSAGYQKRWYAMLFICVSLMVISLDNTILNVALPSIARDLQASASDLQWIVDAYILVFAALLLTMGSIGDRLGRKRALQGGLVLFGIGSLASALSANTGALTLSRAFMGIGGATIMPATLSIITATFPTKERPQAIALWAAVFGLGVGIGPVLGGWLLQNFHWNSVFYVNIPVIIVALAGGAYYITDSKDEHAPKTDVPGVLLSITGLFSLVYGIIRAGSHGWTDDQVLISFGVAAVLLAAFAWWENHSPNAMLPLHFFKNMSFTGANTALALVTFSLFGSVFFLSQYLQSVLGYTALESGIRVLPMALTMTVMAALSARISSRLGTKITVSLGIFICAIGLLVMSATYHIDTSYGTIVIGMVIMAAGLGIAMSPATNSIMGSVPLNKAGIGSAMNDTTRQLGGALGVAVLGTVLNNGYITSVETLKTSLPAFITSSDQFKQAYDAIASSIQAAHIVAADPRVPQAFKQTILDAANQGFVNGMGSALLIGGIIMVFSAALALLILPAQVRRSVEDAPVETPSTEMPAVASVGD